MATVGVKGLTAFCSFTRGQRLCWCKHAIYRICF